MTLILRDYQDEACYSLFEYFDKNTGNPVVAMPTGTGKSLVIADFVTKALTYYNRTRVMMLTHVKELISQNADKLQQIWPTAPLGIYSAGLKQRDIMLPIIFGGIQSVSKNPGIFGHRDLIMIDEAHLLSPNSETMYQRTISELKKINPFLKVVGFTATPYRTGQGMITDDGIFTDICCDYTTLENFNRLIAQGYICPLISRKTSVEMDMRNVGISQSNQDWKQGEMEYVAEGITEKACLEIVNVARDRKTWLIFGAGIKNTEHIAELLNRYGANVAAVHSDLSEAENDKRIRDLRNGTLRGLVNMNKLTTGVDIPQIDYIGNLRATRSTGLHVQLWGRGTRPFPFKLNCLGSDFTPNTRNLGPINDPRIPGKPGNGNGEMAVKLCNVCGAYNYIAARECVGCGAPFQFQEKITATPSTVDFIVGDRPVIEYFDVKKVIYNLHQKKRDGIPVSPPMMKVTYYCREKRFNAFVMFEHSGYAGVRARNWWRQHAEGDVPNSTEDALRRCSSFRVPARLRVWMKEPYPDILGYEY